MSCLVLPCRLLLPAWRRTLFEIAATACAAMNKKTMKQRRKLEIHMKIAKLIYLHIITKDFACITCACVPARPALPTD